MPRLAFSSLSLSFMLALGALTACSEEDSTDTDTGTPALSAEDIAEIETRAEQLVAAGVPGVSLAIIAGDQTVLVTRGVAELTTNTALTSDHRFRAASIAKSLLASVVLQLVDEGEVSLSDTVEDWLPGMIPGNSDATLENVMRLQSGIFDHAADERHMAPYFAGDFAYSWTPEALVALSSDHAPLFAPGERFNYSNTNYVLIGLIIQKVTGKPLAEVVRERIFEPLGMSASSMPTGSELESPYSNGYMLGIAEQPVDVTHISASSTFGHGNYVSTPLDAARFYGALARGEVVSKAQLPDMFTPDPHIETRYGIGVWRMSTFYPCGTFIGHDGSIPGYDVSAYSSLDGKRQFSVMVNDLTPAETVGDEAAQEAWKQLQFAAACN
jgi:D-alanyl-D-alanine carboxypeptidase